MSNFILKAFSVFAPFSLEFYFALKFKDFPAPSAIFKDFQGSKNLRTFKVRAKPVITDWQFTLGAIATNILDDVRWIDRFIPFTHSSFYDCSSFCKQALCLEIAKDVVYGELACRRLHGNPENKPEGLYFSKDIF